jgi:hypothetical protein
MDFHPNMLANQGDGAPTNAARPNQGGSFHPGMLSRQQLAGLGTADPAAVAPAGTELPGGIRLDMPAGVIWIGNSPVKLIPAIVSAIAVKLIFFGGNQIAKGAKHLASRGKVSAATNPGRGRGYRPWKALVYGKGCRSIASTRWGTQQAAESWAEANAHRGVGTRVSCVG